MSFKLDKLSGPAEDKYNFLSKLGSGSFADVFLAKERTTNQEWAVKRMKLKQVNEDRRAVMNEIRIMSKLHHPNIIFMHESFETSDELCIVMELMRGGELLDRIIAKGSYTEKDAAAVLKILFHALAYMHSQNIAHCDIKPENLVYVTPDPDSNLKIIDFGLSHVVEPGGKPDTTIVGTPEYIAPEVVMRKGYAPAVDMWSMGVITYVLLCGYLPFYGGNVKEVFKMVCFGKVDYPTAEWGSISEDAKDLIRQLLNRDPVQRMTADQALQHPWIQAAPDVAVPDVTVQNLKAFNAKMRFKRGILAAMAVGKFSNSLRARPTETSGSSPRTEGSTASTSSVTSEPATASSPKREPVPAPERPEGANDQSVAKRMMSLGRMKIDLESVSIK